MSGYAPLDVAEMLRRAREAGRQAAETDPNDGAVAAYAEWRREDAEVDATLNAWPEDGNTLRNTRPRKVFAAFAKAYYAKADEEERGFV